MVHVPNIYPLPRELIDDWQSSAHSILSATCMSFLLWYPQGASLIDWLFLSHKNNQDSFHAHFLVLGFLQILAGITVLILLDFPACKLYNFFCFK